MNPKYPIYVISKGRSEICYTAQTLEYMNVPYHLVVEPQEFHLYAKHFNSKRIVTTPFSNLGKGSIPVRNFVWGLSKKNGDKRHWIIDDNIKYFFRLNENMKIPVNSGTIFKVAEDFVDRYTNVKMAGLQYFYFASRKQKMNPFILNTRIYSCILLSNDLELEWRGKYNEDTDLSIRILKQGWCTILFNAFLCGKIPTLLTKGGNAEIYNQTNLREEFVDSLIKQHPDIVKKVWRYNRWHHEVDYSSFKKNELIYCRNFKTPSKEINNYGMILNNVPNYQSIFSYEEN